jgi:two-component system cell cycle sensor histidine kinase/response regulator CckA
VPKQTAEHEMMKKIQILLIEDVEADFLLIDRHLRQSELLVELRWVRDADELRAALVETPWDVVLSDYNVPGLDFVVALEVIRQKLPDQPIILVSGSIGEEIAVELLKSGLCDFVLKDRLHRLVPAIERSLNELAEKQRRRAAEQKLANNVQLMHAVLDGTADGIFVKDLQGRYLLVNKAAAGFVGYEPEAIVGRDDTFLFGPPTAARIMARDRMIIDKGTPQIQEEWVTSRNGQNLVFLVTSGPIFDREGEINGTFGVALDITERKRAEEEQKKLEAQLNQAQKMETVGRLAGGVAHDFNNMLSVITGYAELALDKVAPTDPLHHDLLEIISAGRRSAAITRQLLAFARKQIIVPRVLDLNETVEDMLKILRRLIGEDIDMVWLPGKGLWPVRMDPSQVDQLLANLCVNCRDAIAGVGKVTIETDIVSIDEAYCVDHVGASPGDYVLLSVSDDGCGMDKETQDKIFEPFFTTKKLGEGTGLGLATVYGIVTQNNGFINVYSEPDKGTTFRIYLARHAEQLAEVEPEVPEKVSSVQGETVLVVEDEVAILKLIAKILTKLGYVILTSKSAIQAIDLAKGHPGAIDLLITDVIMPEMNGRDLANQLVALRPTLKCLFMSGYTASVIARQGVLDEGVHFMQKPFTSRSLAAKVQEVLRP